MTVFLIPALDPFAEDGCCVFASIRSGVSYSIPNILSIWVQKINADDKVIVSALKERGYQRFATTYIMTKNL